MGEMDGFLLGHGRVFSLVLRDGKVRECCGVVCDEAVLW